MTPVTGAVHIGPKKTNVTPITATLQHQLHHAVADNLFPDHKSRSGAINLITTAQETQKWTGARIGHGVGKRK